MRTERSTEFKISISFLAVKNLWPNVMQAFENIFYSPVIGIIIATVIILPIIFTYTTWFFLGIRRAKIYIIRDF